MDIHSVRLDLATDGFNLFQTLSFTYSIWSVILILYNLSPWMCMKLSSLILSMIIASDKSPDNDIDMFLQPFNRGIETTVGGYQYI